MPTVCAPVVISMVAHILPLIAMPPQSDELAARGTVRPRVAHIPWSRAGRERKVLWISQISSVSVDNVGFYAEKKPSSHPSLPSKGNMFVVCRGG